MSWPFRAAIQMTFVRSLSPPPTRVFLQLIIVLVLQSIQCHEKSCSADNCGHKSMKLEWWGGARARRACDRFFVTNWSLTHSIIAWINQLCIGQRLLCHFWWWWTDTSDVAQKLINLEQHDTDLRWSRSELSAGWILLCMQMQTIALLAISARPWSAL